ncbi:cyclin-H-like isoform X2 [Halichondria panicea]|uniref:cyclin-H-like isoform X2 n=1 Tax=Halichondria panicea TaxID=6063 RepID=UPI00312B9A69
MYHSSTQKRDWLFKDQQSINVKREAANRAFCSAHEASAQEKGVQLLTPVEEDIVVQYYLKKLVEFCSLFNPPSWAPLPKTALVTAVTYYKRLYTQCSVMEFHPKDMFLCCVFLAFKVDEYNLSLEQFVNMLAPHLIQSTSEYIISHELLLLKKLQFQLTVHSPFRPMSGFILDMKTRAPQLPNPDMFRKVADSFLVQSLGSDVAFLYPPSQIGLAALWHSAKQTHNRVDGYILSVLLNSEGSDTIDTIMDLLQKIEDLVFSVKLPDGAMLAPVEAKLQQCSIQALTIATTTTKRKRQSEDNLSVGGSDGKKHRSDQEPSPWSLEID